MNFVSLLQLFIFQSLISSILCNHPEIITIPYKEFFGGFHTILRFGNPSQTVLEGINLAHPYTFTSDFFFQVNRSMTIQILDNESPQFNIDTKTYKGVRLIDKISLPYYDAIIDGYSFYLIERAQFDDNKRRTGFAFANKFTDSSFSIVYLLKQSNVITHLSFAFIPDNSDTNDRGMISFGGIDDMSVFENKTVTKCKVNNDGSINTAWSCSLSYVFIGDVSYDKPSKNVYYKNNNDYAYFQSSTRMIIAPKRFIDFLYSQLFNRLIKNSHCVIEAMNNRNTIKCRLESMSLMPNITFIFDDSAYSFNITTFFECLISYCTFLIIPNEDEAWIFGTVFIKNFVMNFDYEENTITLYSNNTLSIIKEINIDKLVPVRYWIWICVLIGTIFILFYAYYTCIYLKNLQRNSNKTYINSKYIDKDSFNQ